jgi:hypothetical protein
MYKKRVITKALANETWTKMDQETITALIVMPPRLCHMRPALSIQPAMTAFLT